MQASSRKFNNLITGVLPFLIIFFLWPEYYYYDIQVFKLALAAIGGAGFLSFRIAQGGKFQVPRFWPVILMVYGFFVISLVLSQNTHAGVSRLVLLLGLGVWYFILQDALSSFLNPLTFLKALIVVSGLMMVISLLDIYSAYRQWWDAFGIFGESPPYPYRLDLPLHANHMIAFINLFMPVVAVLLVTSRKKAEKLSLAVWLLMYGIVAYFSSSRGGYVGAAGGLGILVLLLVDWNSIRLKLLALPRAKRWYVLIVTIMIVLVLAAAGYTFLAYMSAHPSHASDGEGLNLNRGSIWRAYLNIWLADPLFGAGIGRSINALFDANRTIPPDWLPIHSHNMPLGILAEFGVIGSVLIFTMVGLAGYHLVQGWRSQEGDVRILCSGLLAGLAALAVHSLIEDFLLEPIVLVLAIALVAWVVSRYEDEERSVSYPVAWLSVVMLLSVGLSFWNLYPTRHLTAASLARVLPVGLDAIERAELLDAAILERPRSHLLLTQGAVFWVESWEETGSQEALLRAEELLSAALTIEPGESFEWMNMANIHWMLGSDLEALEAVGKAISLAPNEPTYYLNRGWYLESLGRADEAFGDYLDALELSEKWGWSNHPFWSGSEVRQAVVNHWLADNKQSGPDPNMIDFWMAFSAGDMDTANQAYARVVWEHDPAKMQQENLMEGLLAVTEGEGSGRDLIRLSYRSSINPLRSPLYTWKRFYYRTTGIGTTFLPGVLQLSQDYGQMHYFEEIYDQLSGVFTEEELCYLERDYQIALNGGAFLLDSSLWSPNPCEK